MRKLIIWSIASLMMLLVLVQCKQKNEGYEPVQNSEMTINSNLKQVVVKEVLNANAYTYLFVSEGDKEYWMAIPLTDVEVGKTYAYESGMEMKNFESKDLNRTFESVYFVESLVDPSAPVKTTTETTSNPHGGNAVTENGETKTQLSEGIVLAKGAISLHDLFSGKDKLAGKTVTLTGKVVSFNPEIMGKNWIHLQDGSSFKGLNDVIVTTLAKVAINDVVTIKGMVVLNKDLGSGYKYDILIEDATIVK
jgi:hypothetical protein